MDVQKFVEIRVSVQTRRLQEIRLDCTSQRQIFSRRGPSGYENSTPFIYYYTLDQTLHNAVSDCDLHSLFTEISTRNTDEKIFLTLVGLICFWYHRFDQDSELRVSLTAQPSQCIHNLHIKKNSPTKYYISSPTRFLQLLAVILFSRRTLKDIFATIKSRDCTAVILPFREGFISAKLRGSEVLRK